MTQDEELNIGTTLQSVINRFDQVVVVDSFSTDGTSLVCKSFQSVDLYTNKFIHWADQRNWMLHNCNIKNEWVFFLDADESIDDEFFKELTVKFSTKPSDVTSFFINKDLYFLGSKLNFSYGHPKIRLIFKKDGLLYHAEGAREYATIQGSSIEIKRGLIHEDRRPFDCWIIKHINNAEREKNLYFERGPTDGRLPTDNIPFSLKVRKLIRYKIWNRLPFGVRPILYFIFRYFFKLGFLDGRPGLFYCINHALWYEMLIDIKIMDRLRDDRKK
jgi:glycosyltransferase involved in cell wall biosynthesis